MNIDRALDVLVRPITKLLEQSAHKFPKGGVDLAVGFGVGGVGPNGESNLISEDIARYCALLNLRGIARGIILTGGSGTGSVTEASAMKSVALAMGVPKEAIFIEQHSRNTHINALNVVRLIKASFPAWETNLLSIATVGQSLHAGRCYACLKKVAPKSWTIFRLKAGRHYDPYCTQWRWRNEWRLAPWELAWRVLSKFLRWT
jgi:uncharacterized SAM-binding protein YcdF (DUF218 family)